MRKPSATAIGAFVLGALVLVAAAVLFFGGGALLTKRLPAVSFFQGSVAGLQNGAPVTFRGVQIGGVTSIGIRVNPQSYGSIIQVNMQLLPESVTFYGAPLPHDESLMPKLVERGLTAKLVMQSLVTGQLAVELDFRPEAQAKPLGASTAAPEIPSVPSDVQAIAQKLADLDLGATLESAQRTLAALDGILTAPGLTQTIEELPALANQLRQTLTKLDTEVLALSRAGRTAIRESASTLQLTLESVQTLAATIDREVAGTAGAAQETLERGNTALDGASSLLDPRGRTAVQMQRAVDDLAVTAARLRALAERVDRDPSILIRGRR
jgi:paraquat-inducible protein B